jgi:hypothetical protein
LSCWRWPRSSICARAVRRSTAGLPLLFALGIRSLAHGAGGDASSSTGRAPHSIGTVVAWILFVVVLLGVALGITFIVASGLGKALSFEHIFPTIVDK